MCCSCVEVCPYGHLELFNISVYALGGLLGGSVCLHCLYSI